MRQIIADSFPKESFPRGRVKKNLFSYVAIVWSCTRSHTASSWAKCLYAARRNASCECHISFDDLALRTGQECLLLFV